MKLVIKAYKIAGWFIEFIGEDAKKIQNYCKEMQEEIEYFVGGPNEEDLIRETIENEDYDIYDDAMCTDLSLEDYYPLFDEYLKIFIEVDGELKPIDMKNIKVNKEAVTSQDWKNDNKGKNAIAYSFGYTSDEEIETEYNCECGNIDINLLKITLTICENELYENLTVVTNVKINNCDCDKDDEDFSGEYFNSTYFAAK